MALHDAFAGSGGEKTLADIFRSNCIQRGDSSPDGVLCETASRFNRSCVPNCEKSWDENKEVLQIFACTSVSAGQELCVHYVDLQAPAAARQQGLEPFGFICGCPACRPGSEEGDRRRQRLQELVPQVVPVSEEDPWTALSMISEALRLYDEEDIHLKSLRKFACYFAFQLSLSLGDLSRARNWVDQAYEYSKLCHGPDHATTLCLGRYAEDPCSHPAARIES